MFQVKQLALLSACVVGGFSILTTGCAEAPAVAEPAAPAANQPVQEEPKAKDEGLNFNGLLRKATDLADTVQQKGGDAADDTGKMVTDMFNTLKDQGVTQANNATEWATQDYKNMNAWEYKVLRVKEFNVKSLEKNLNEMGSQRWECFNVQSSDGSQVFYFKRQKKSYLKVLPLKDLMKLVPMMGGEDG